MPQKLQFSAAYLLLELSLLSQTALSEYFLLQNKVFSFGIAVKVGKGVAGWWREACWWIKVSFLGKAPRHFTQIKCPSLPLACVLTYIRINCYRTHSRLHCYPKDIVNKMNWFSCSVQIIVFFNFSIYTTTPGSNHLHRPLRWNWLHLLSETIVFYTARSRTIGFSTNILYRLVCCLIAHLRDTDVVAVKTEQKHVWRSSIKSVLFHNKYL